MPYPPDEFEGRDVVRVAAHSHPSEDHADRHGEGEVDELKVEDLGTDGTEDQVYRAGSSGNVLVGDLFPLTYVFTSSGSITAGDPVYISGANTVSTASATEKAQVIGVANESVGTGVSVKVVVYGPRECTADGAISPGDLVTVASTSGRVEAFTYPSTQAESEAGTGVADDTHDHDYIIVSVTGTAGDHTHSQAATQIENEAGVTVNTTSHTHSISSASPSTGGPNESFEAGDGSHHHNGTTDPPTTTFFAASSNHIHNVDSHDHGGATGSSSFNNVVVADDDHTHDNPDTDTDGPHQHTLPGIDGPNGTTNVASLNHTHPQQGVAGVILGKALTSAAGAGSTVDVFVTLS